VKEYINEVNEKTKSPIKNNDTPFISELKNLNSKNKKS
jgi:hypothetical protein